MKKVGLVLISCCFLAACQSQQEENAKFAEEIRENKQEQLIKDVEEINENLKRVPLYHIEENAFMSVRDFFTEIDGHFSYDSVNKVLTMNINGNEHKLIYGVPVLQVNGNLIPSEDIFFIINDGQALLPTSFLTEAIGIETKFANDQVEFVWQPSAEPVSAPIENQSSVLGNVEEVIGLMKGFQNPIKGANVDTVSTHLPGANRSYRNGVHEGMDWYGYSSGIHIDRNTEILGMYEGVVVRADHEYKGFSSEAERNNQLQIAAESEKTPEYILDKLRGKQVWIQYDNGVQARYAHLDQISPAIKVGSRVNANTLIGYVGNSGTSGEVKQDNTELHLHLDILINGELFWKDLTQDEVVKVLETVFLEEN